MDSQTLFIEAVRTAEHVPTLVRQHAHEVAGLEETCFDESYIEFLDTQIRLSPRGPEWTERLKKRRAALFPFCGVRLLRGTIRTDGADFTVRVDPQAKAVIYCEEYEHENAT